MKEYYRKKKESFFFWLFSFAWARVDKAKFRNQLRKKLRGNEFLTIEEFDVMLNVFQKQYLKQLKLSIKNQVYDYYMGLYAPNSKIDRVLKSDVPNAEHLFNYKSFAEFRNFHKEKWENLQLGLRDAEVTLSLNLSHRYLFSYLNAMSDQQVHIMTSLLVYCQYVFHMIDHGVPGFSLSKKEQYQIERYSLTAKPGHIISAIKNNLHTLNSEDRKLMIETIESSLEHYKRIHKLGTNDIYYADNG